MAKPPRKFLLHWKIKERDDNHIIWVSVGGQYRIWWRNAFAGVSVTPGYIVSVRGQIGERLVWDRVDIAGRVFKTKRKAMIVCDKHYRKQLHLAKEKAKNQLEKKPERKPKRCPKK